MTRVDFEANVMDLQTILLGSYGFSTNYIQRKTKFRAGQILYRLRKARVKRMDYRNGGSPIAKTIFKETEERIINQVRNLLRKQEMLKKRIAKKLVA